jgi:hypothetical protein
VWRQKLSKGERSFVLSMCTIHFLQQYFQALLMLFGFVAPLTLLTVALLTLSFPFMLLVSLFVAHTLSLPASASGAAVLAGSVTALVGLFCVSLVKDAADTLYVCYCIDKDIGEQRREVFILVGVSLFNLHLMLILP